MLYKVKKLLIVFLIVLIVLFIMYLIFWPIAKLFMPKISAREDNDGYLTGKYKKYTDGALAEQYLPDPKELGNYESLRFVFVNNIWKRLYLDRIGNEFYLEVFYEDIESFQKTASAMIKKYALAEYPESDIYVVYASVYENSVLVDKRDDLGLAFRKCIPSSKHGNAPDMFYIVLNDESKCIKFVFRARNGEDTNISKYHDPIVKQQKEKYFSEIS